MSENKLDLIDCERCGHPASRHEHHGMHKCFEDRCKCNYFVVPRDIDDINTPDNVTMKFGKNEPVTENYVFNQFNELPQPVDLQDNYKKIAKQLGMDPELIESSLRDLENKTQKTTDDVVPDPFDVRDPYVALREHVESLKVEGVSLNQFKSTPIEIRTVASTGAEKGVKEARYDLIPVPALDLLARLYGKGAAKYAAHNWRKGYEWSKSYAAAQRHMTLFWEGEDIDPEMQLPHVICAAFHMFALATYMTEHPEMDDRFHTVMAREAKETEEETSALTTADILEELASDYINRGDNKTAKVLLAVARDEKSGKQSE